MKSTNFFRNPFIQKKKDFRIYKNYRISDFFSIQLLIINSLIFSFTFLPKISSFESKTELMVGWFNTNFGAIDIGVGSKGDVFVLGIDMNLYFYEFKTNNFILVDKDYKLRDTNFIRLDVDENGIPFVITEEYEIYFYSEQGTWIHLPGCARDIGIGKSNNLWKIGCNEEIEGYGIWNLFSFNNQKNNDLNKINFNGFKNNKNVPLLISEKINIQRKLKNTYKRNKYRITRESTQINFKLKDENNNEYTNENYSDCFWLKSDTSGIRIDVGENGNPVISDKGGNLKIYDNNSRRTYFFDGIKVRDVSVSNDGIIFVTDFNDFSIYKLTVWKKNKNKSEEREGGYISNINSLDDEDIDYENYEWIKIFGKAISISSGPYSQPFIINREGLVWTSSKFDFN